MTRRGSLVASPIPALRAARSQVAPALASQPPDVEALEKAEATDLLAGEVQLGQLRLELEELERRRYTSSLGRAPGSQ